MHESTHGHDKYSDADSVQSQAMFFTMFLNGALGFAAYAFILYCFGNPEETLSAPYGNPFIQIFYNALNSKAGTTALTSLLIALYIVATFGFLASASRQAWAFSRHNGLPFSRVFKQVRVHLFSYLAPPDCFRYTRSGLFLSGRSLSLERSMPCLGSSTSVRRSPSTQ